MLYIYLGTYYVHEDSNSSGCRCVADWKKEGVVVGAQGAGNGAEHINNFANNLMVWQIVRSVRHD